MHWIIGARACEWVVTFHVVRFDQRTCSSACPALSAGWRYWSVLAAKMCAAPRSPVWKCTGFYWCWCHANRNNEWPTCKRLLICLLSWNTSSCVRLNSESSWLWRETDTSLLMYQKCERFQTCYSTYCKTNESHWTHVVKKTDISLFDLKTWCMGTFTIKTFQNHQSEILAM